MTDLVQFELGGKTILVTLETHALLARDEALFGNVYVRPSDKDPNVYERIDPETVKPA